MALVRTNLLGVQSSSSIGTASFTTGAATTTSGQWLVVIGVSISGTAISAANLTISDSRGNTYTSRATVDAAWGVDDAAIRCWTAPVTSAGSTTWTIDAGADSTDQYTLFVLMYDGALQTGIGATASNTNAGTDGAVSMTLGAAPATTSEVIGVWGLDLSGATPATSTPGSTFTEIYNPVTAGHAGAELEVRTGSTSTTVDLVDLNDTAGVVAASLGFAVEILAASGGAPGGDILLESGSYLLKEDSGRVELESGPLSGSTTYIPSTIRQTKANRWLRTFRGRTTNAPRPAATVPPPTYIPTQASRGNKWRGLRTFRGRVTSTPIPPPAAPTVTYIPQTISQRSAAKRLRVFRGRVTSTPTPPSSIPAQQRRRTQPPRHGRGRVIATPTTIANVPPITRSRPWRGSFTRHGSVTPTPPTATVVAPPTYIPPNVTRPRGWRGFKQARGRISNAPQPGLPTPPTWIPPNAQARTRRWFLTRRGETVITPPAAVAPVVTTYVPPNLRRRQQAPRVGRGKVTPTPFAVTWIAPNQRRRQTVITARPRRLQPSVPARRPAALPQIIRRRLVAGVRRVVGRVVPTWISTGGPPPPTPIVELGPPILGRNPGRITGQNAARIEARNAARIQGQNPARIEGRNPRRSPGSFQ